MSNRGTSWRAVALASVLLLTLGLFAVGVSAQTEDDDLQHAVARMQDRDGNDVGQVRFISRGDDTVIVRASVSGIANLAGDWHGFHVHTIGDCSAADFTSAGGHYAREGQVHGEHAGDMPMLRFRDDATAAELWFITDQFTVGELFDADGSAVIVHADPDNAAHIPDRYVSADADPPGTPGPDADTLATGDAGARMACGVVERQPLQ